MLHELATSVSVLHQLLQKGEYASDSTRGTQLTAGRLPNTYRPGHTLRIISSRITKSILSPADITTTSRYVDSGYTL